MAKITQWGFNIVHENDDITGGKNEACSAYGRD